MENKNNQYLNINEIDELNKLKVLNSTLIKELRKYKEENAELQKEKEILYGKIEKLEKENQTLKSDFSCMENKNPQEENMDIVDFLLELWRDLPTQSMLQRPFQHCQDTG